MKNWVSSRRGRRTGAWTAIALAIGVAAWPVIGQEAPKSILPEGFEEPPPPPVVQEPEPVVPATPDAAAPAPATPESGADMTATPAVPPTGPAVDPYLTPGPQRSIDMVGWLSPEAGGYGPQIFAGSNGRFLTGLMRRIDTPIASRWGHIVLRRALLSIVPTPAAVLPADWVAERAWLLLRMGEVDGAKMLVDAVPIDRFTPRLYAVAGQVNLAAADMLALCPLSPTAATLSKDPLWQLTNAMCAGLEGDDITAATIFDALRDREAANPFDILLAERISTAASGGGRAANIEWGEVSKLTTYRFGLASAAGAAIPDTMIAGARPPVAGWLLRSPSAALEARMTAGLTAAALGISSSAELNGLYSAHGATLDPVALDSAPAGRLRAAFVARNPADRLAAMRTLWRGTDAPASRYGNQILTARAAARFPVDNEYEAAAPELIASMLSAGYDRAAVRWWPIVDKADAEVRDAGWALLAVADPGRTVEITPERFEDWYKREQTENPARARHRAQLLMAALDGLGKTRDDGDWADIREDLALTPVENVWTQRLDDAVRGRRAGEVAVLAAVGMQGTWRSMPPQHLARILAAYRSIGRGAEARMVAAEALTRS